MTTMRPPLPPSRFRRVAKWVGVGGVVVILVAWCLTTRVAWNQDIWAYYTGTSNFIMVQQGAISWYDEVNPSAQRGWTLGSRPAFLQSSLSQRLGLMLPGISLNRGNRSGLVYVPLWLPFLLIVIPTAILWRRDRRTVKPGCCLTCGYDASVE